MYYWLQPNLLKDLLTLHQQLQLAPSWCEFISLPQGSNHNSFCLVSQAYHFHVSIRHYEEQIRFVARSKKLLFKPILSISSCPGSLTATNSSWTEVCMVLPWQRSVDLVVCWWKLAEVEYKGRVVQSLLLRQISNLFTPHSQPTWTIC